MPDGLLAIKVPSMRLYQLQVVAGVLLAGLMEILVAADPALPTGIVVGLEGASFLFCCAGLLTGGREHRLAFDAFGRDKSVAKRDAAFMRARAQLQFTSVGAVAAIGVLAARRFGVSAVIPLISASALGLSLPFINRLSGWAKNG